MGGEKMRVLIGMETSGATRDAFRARGFDAWSCDILPCEADPRWHIQGDVFDVLSDGWAMAIFHPSCQFLAGSGLHWNGRIEGRAEKTEAALADVRRLMACPIERWVIENPRGCIGTRIRKADQMIQPYEFGEDASKETHLWLKGLPTLMPTGRFNGRWVRDPRTGRPVERWSNQTDSGQNRLGPSEDRWKERSRTYPGIAAAFAKQFGDYLLNPGFDLFGEAA